MTLPAIFIQSFDCEGLWGIADHVTPEARARLAGAPLAAIYKRLMSILDQVGIVGTFAFVGAFTGDRETLRQQIPVLSALHAACPGFLDGFIADLQSGAEDDWVGSSCLAAVCGAKLRHEIGAHGFSHIPWTWPGFGCDQAAQELEGLNAAATRLGVAIRTFVYPRNLYRHEEMLGTSGFIGYRLTREAGTGSLIRLKRLAREFVPGASEPQGYDAPVVAIPGGAFVNMRFGLRRLVPAAVTVARWKAMADDAIGRKRVAHLWCHPENFTIAPDGLDVLAEILAYVARRAEQGDIVVMTQADYCAALRR